MVIESVSYWKNIVRIKSLFLYVYLDIMLIIYNLEEKTMRMKKIVLSTIIIMIAISSLSMVSAGLFGSDTQKVTVDGVDFVLDGNFKITSQQNTLVNFVVKTGTTGYLSTILNDNELNSYIQNDTELGYTVSEVSSNSNVKEYAFIQDDIDKGYFIIFQKEGKNFVYCISTGLNADNKNIEEIAESIAEFTIDNKDIKPI